MIFDVVQIFEEIEYLDDIPASKYSVSLEHRPGFLQLSVRKSLVPRLRIMKKKCKYRHKYHHYQHCCLTKHNFTGEPYGLTVLF